MIRWLCSAVWKKWRAFVLQDCIPLIGKMSGFGFFWQSFLLERVFDEHLESFVSREGTIRGDKPRISSRCAVGFRWL